MKTTNGILGNTVGRLVVAGGLALAVVAAPAAVSMVGASATGTVVNAESGIGQLQWVYDTEPRVQVPHVDTTVHQSR